MKSVSQQVLVLVLALSTSTLGAIAAPDSVSSVADLNACVQEAHNMQIIPLSLGCVLQTLVAAALPFLVVVATQVPLAEILKWFVGAIF